MQYLFTYLSHSHVYKSTKRVCTQILSLELSTVRLPWRQTEAAISHFLLNSVEVSLKRHVSSLF